MGWKRLVLKVIEAKLLIIYMIGFAHLSWKGKKEVKRFAQ